MFATQSRKNRLVKCFVVQSRISCERFKMDAKCQRNKNRKSELPFLYAHVHSSLKSCSDPWSPKEKWSLSLASDLRRPLAALMNFWFFFVIIKQKWLIVARSGDQCLLGDSVTEVKLRRARLVPGWVTTREDWALWTCVRSSVWTSICDRPSK